MAYWFLLLVTGLLLLGLGMVAFFVRGHKAGPFLSFMARYVAVFTPLLAIDVILVWLLPFPYSKACSATAAISGAILGLTEAEVTVTGSMIWMQDPPLNFEISVACLGTLLFWIYIGLVWAESRSTRRQRASGAIAGVIILLGFNFFRIIVSIYVEWSTGLGVHDWFYAINMAFVLLLWAVWLRTLKLRARPAAPRPLSSQWEYFR